MVPCRQSPYLHKPAVIIMTSFSYDYDVIRYCAGHAQHYGRWYVTYRHLTAFNIHCESKKGCHPNHGYNFVNSWSICKILSLLQRAVNFQQKPYYVTHHTLSMLLHYLGKFKIRNFVLFVHVKRFKREFVSSIQQISFKCHKVGAKINNVQNISIFLFVHSLSLTGLKLCSWAR